MGRGDMQFRFKVGALRQARVPSRRLHVRVVHLHTLCGSGVCMVQLCVNSKHKASLAHAKQEISLSVTRIVWCAT